MPGENGPLPDDLISLFSSFLVKFVIRKYLVFFSFIEPDFMLSGGYS